ncbi:MAG TPA: ABC transporter permease [Nitrospiria bacterium]|nr:ABC transporter permease [Nitrospiria bacterium]
MIRSLVVRDIRTRYMGSFLGVFWALVHPLTQLIIFYFVFSVVLKAKLGAEYADTNYALWLMSGMLPWIIFSEVVSRSPNAVLEQANLIRKTVFPSEILPFAHVSAALVNHLILFVMLLGFLLLSGQGLSLKLAWLPLYLAGIILFALGLAWILSALNVFLRDIGQILGVLLNLWFFFTPIIYPASLIPEAFRPWLALNPMLYPVEGYRMALLGRTEPDFSGLVILFIWGIGAFMVGGLVFKKLKPAFADVL